MESKQAAFAQMENFTRRQFLRLGACACLAACSSPLHSGSAPNPVLKIQPRTYWGALEPDLDASAEYGRFDRQSNPEGWLTYTEPLPEVYNTLIVHHSALPVADGPLEIQRLHMQNKGYADIGYHFLINDRGGVSAGRVIQARGAHTGGFNTGTVGVVLLGNFESLQPTDLQLRALQSLGRYLANEYTLTHLAGHRDFQPGVTVCPGANLEPLLPTLANDLGLQFGSGGYVSPEWVISRGK